MQKINISPLPAQTFNIVLDGQNCTISLYWRQTRLYLDLNVGATEICRGAICQNRADIMQSPSPDFSGTLHFFDLEGEQAPHYSGLNSRWLLLYLAAGEGLPQGLRY